MGRYLLFICVFLFTRFLISNGCEMEGVTQWLEPQHFHFQDTHRGLIISKTTTTILGINRIDIGDGLFGGPYLDITYKDSVFAVSTTEAFVNYEEYETLLSIRFTVTFNCQGGTTRLLAFVFNINDTNNHAPVFRPSDSFEYSLALPVPPGFKVSGCDFMIVRDIDLTTTAIKFDIEDNEYFEIVYHGQIQPKEFGAFIRTKTLIRSLPETLSFEIHATDVDETSDPPLTTTAVVKIVADNAFRLPDPLIFSAAFYNADYTHDHDLILREYISLREGYDDQVKFGHQGEYAQNFELVENQNQLSFRVKSPLPENVLESPILLVVTAERELATGASATVVIHLPKVTEIEIQFELPLYEGEIEDNVLRAPNLVLLKGYEETTDIKIINAYASYFSAKRNEDVILLSMDALPAAVIRDNNVLNLQVVASTSQNNTALSIVVLEIIKDDYTTPAFEKPMYNATYDAETGLTVEPIKLVQGFDNTVAFNLIGDHANLFEIVEQSAVITLRASIPQEIWSEGNILITVQATKPRTIAANTAVLVHLPRARELTFESPSYRGTLENNEVFLETIVLNLGYASDVTFDLSGDFSSYFTTNNTGNAVTVGLLPVSGLPENIILENNALMLSLSASGLNALTATTNILLDIIKDDHVTPVFERAIYRGTYDPLKGLSLEQNIIIVQGYDDTIDAESLEVVLDGDQAHLFDLKREGRTITIEGVIPAEIWPEQNLILTLKATRPRTVGANTVIQITLPAARELSFEKLSYIGRYRNNTITIGEIILSVGYSSDIKFELLGEYSNNFVLLNEDNKLSISLKPPLPENVVLENNFIVLSIRAYGLNAVTTFTTILLEIIKDDIITPIFSKNIYEGTYINEFNFEVEEISLIQGYDDTVSFSIEGEHSQYFDLNVTGNNVEILIKSAIPEELIFNEKRLLFKVTAVKDLTIGGTAVVSIRFPTELTEPTIMRFSQSAYLGSLKDDTFEILDSIVLEAGFRPDTQFNLDGDYAPYFKLTSLNNIVTISLRNSLPTEEVMNVEFIILQIKAERERAVSVSASLIIDIVKPDSVVFPIFEKPFYTGSLKEENGLQFEEVIRLEFGFDETVIFELEGDDSQYFLLDHTSPNNIGLLLNGDSFPQDTGRNHLKFSIIAVKPNSITGRSAIFISLTERSLRFSSNYYTGTIKEDILNLDLITLEEGYSEDVEFQLSGDYIDYFQISNEDGNITFKMIRGLPVEIKEKHNIIILTLKARVNRIRTHTAIILEIAPSAIDTNPVMVFENTYYTGSYSEASGINFDSFIKAFDGLSGLIKFSLEGEQSIWFGIERKSENSVALILKSPISPAILQNNRKLIFVITATRPESMTGRATIVISLIDDFSIDRILGFEHNSYSGSIDNNILTLNPIFLHEGYTKQVSFNIRGDLATYFIAVSDGPMVTINLRNAIPEDSIPTKRIILLELFASAQTAVPAVATIVLFVNRRDDDTPVFEQLSFQRTYYTGLYTKQDGLTFDQIMSLSTGYDDKVIFTLEGENSIWFGLEWKFENAVALTLTSSIPPVVLNNNRKIIFVITATRPEGVPARAAVVVSFTDDSTGPTVTFENILYNGVISLGNVRHEQITILGYDGTNVEISGQYAELFQASLSAGEVTINTKQAAILPNVSHIALELQADVARAVLLLNIVDPETPVLPTVTFESPSYVLRVDLTHTGTVGQVQATSDNGETIRYSLLIDNVHLRERLSVNNDGVLRLSAPANTGAYSFEVVATTTITQVSATVSVFLSVEAAIICGDDIVVPPLIILDRDEEEPHRNLVVLNQNAHEGCQYILRNIWPREQNWLYVDSEGLHTTKIDREDESIAFMTVSQIQVELILECESDVTSRTKRSLGSKSTADWPYDYGSNKWILTDTIQFNARRSLVNLIVNDINDNVPIFVGTDNGIIVVGYPVPELANIILPRALVQLKATDADIGENAEILYWSSEDILAVSPSTGLVHVRNNSNLQNSARLTVHATDQNGAGHTSNLELTVKLLESNQIAVLNIRNAFLEDEGLILSNLSKSLGFEVKTLRTVVISESSNSRNNRDASSGLAASLQLFVYGLIEREPIDIKEVIEDINSGTVTVNVASIISLEDHLKGNEICELPGRDNGLLAATIVLSVLSFILIVVIAVLFFLKWRKNKNYEQFSDKNSLTPRNDSLVESKSEVTAKPRLNIEDLKRSERKLQERLDAPVTDILSEPSVLEEKPIEAIINISPPDPQLPIVIQTIDKLKDNTEDSEDEDEFGEKMKSRRKSVVTFNENVEKIIHVEDTPDNQPVEDYEIFRL